MKFCNMAVVVPVDQLTGSKAALSAQVWGQVSNLLMPALGKLYRQFHPANDAWGHKLTSPFGVVLGCQEPELFLTLFLAGQQTQQEAAAFHAAAMIKKVDMDKAQKAGDSLICPVVVDGSDPELMIHALWHISLQKGAPLPDWDLLCRPRACGRISRGTAGDSVKPCRICPLRRAAQPGGGKR